MLKIVEALYYSNIVVGLNDIGFVYRGMTLGGYRVVGKVVYTT